MPIKYADYEYWIAAIQLVLAMLGMGAALTPNDFRAVARWPFGVIVTLILQSVMCPLLALVVVRMVPMPAGIAIGLFFTAALPPTLAC